MRVCSGGNSEFEALVRITIQCVSSQLFAGKMKDPVKVAPACNSIVSPQLALFSALCKEPPAFTIVTFPGVGVFTIVVFMYTRGNSAAPS